MYLKYNKPSMIMSYPKGLEITKKAVMQEKKKMKYPMAWNYEKTKTGGHKLKFSKKQFKKYYVSQKPKNSYYNFNFTEDLM